MRHETIRWTGLILINVILWGMLGFHQMTLAQRPARLPFDNPVEQRNELIEQIKETNALLKEQNALLQSGRIKVVVVEAQR